MAFTYCTNCGEKIDDSVERCPHCNHPKGVDRVYGYTSENFGKKETTEQQGNGQNTNGQSGNPYNGGQNQYGQNGNPYNGGQNQYGQNGNPYNGGQNQYGQNGNPYNGGQNQNRGTQNPWENNGQNQYGQGGGQGGNPYGNGQGRNPWENNSGPWQNPNSGPYYGGNAPWQPRERRNLSVGLIVFSIINILLGTCCAGSIFGIIGLVFAITARDAATEEEEIRRKKISLAINIIAVVLTVAFIISFAIGFFQAGGIEAFLPQ